MEFYDLPVCKSFIIILIYNNSGREVVATCLSGTKHCKDTYSGITYDDMYAACFYLKKPICGNIYW